MLRIATEPESLMTSVKVCEPVTKLTSREKAADGVSTERSYAPCTAAEGELSMARGLCHSKGERAPDPQLSLGRAPVPEFGPGRATDPKSSPPSSPLVPASSAPPERHPVPTPRRRPPEPVPPEHTPVSAPVPEFSPGSLEAHK